VELFINLSAVESQIKRGPEIRSPCVAPRIPLLRLPELGVVVPGPIGKNGRIQKLPATGTLPGIERADKIIKFLCEHAALTTWTMHNYPPRLMFYNGDGRVVTSIVPITHIICLLRQ